LLFTQLNAFPKEASFVRWLLYLALFSSLFAVAFGTLKVWLTKQPIQDWRRRIHIEALLLSVFFLLIIFLKLHHYGNESGMLRGTHGRYFFACIGSLLVAWIIPGMHRLSTRPLLAWGFVLLMVSAEFCLWIAEVIPYFEVR